MKREQKCNPNPKSIFPTFFWKYCERCKMKFRNEEGWEYGYWECFGDYNTVYVCKSCAPTQKDAYNILVEA